MLYVLVPVKVTVYQEEITANVGEEIVMACMVEGNPIVDAYWLTVHGNRIESDWKFEVTSRFCHLVFRWMLSPLMSMIVKIVFFR